MKKIRLAGNQTAHLIAYHQKKRVPLIFYGIITGVFAGAVSCLYRFLVDELSGLSVGIYGYLNKHPGFIALWFLALMLLALAVRFIIKAEPLIRGSGIPQIEGELKGRIDMNWWRVLLAKFTGGLLCLFAGFSLGREGPSIQLGGAAGKGVTRLFKRPDAEEKYMITGGASAGLAAAFNAPLAGVIFSLEEVHGHFSPAVLLTAMSSAIVADLISKFAFGGNAVLEFKALPVLPLQWLPYLVILGVVLGAGGALFNGVILKTQDLYAKIPEKYRLFIPFAVCCAVGLFLPMALGGGHGVILSVSSGNTGFALLLILLAVRFAFTMVCFGSGAPGGIFLPLLTIGALLGAIFGKSLAGVAALEQTYVPTFIALAMAGYFAAVVRAPVTGIILITEMTGSFSHLLSLSIIVIISYLAAELCRSKPIYESLLERLLRRQGNAGGGEARKEIIEIVVYLDSMLDGKKIRDVSWPEKSLIVGIRRGSEEIIPNGETVLGSGDTLIFITDTDRAASARHKIQKLATTTHY